MSVVKDFSDYNTLLISLRQRDIAAFNHLYVSLRKKLFVLALYIVGDEENAKDIVQDLFIDFWEKRIYENINVSIEYYLYRAVKNKAITSKKKQTYIALAQRELPYATFENGYGSLDNNELGKELDAAINQLPPMSSKVFQLHYINHLSYKEISLKLGISHSTISTHMDRALKKLRSSLQKSK